MGWDQLWDCTPVWWAGDDQQCWCFRLFGSLAKRNRNARWDKEGFGVKGQLETGPDGGQECLDVQTGNSMPLRCGQHAGSDRELSGAKIH